MPVLFGVNSRHSVFCKISLEHYFHNGSKFIIRHCGVKVCHLSSSPVFLCVDVSQHPTLCLLSCCFFFIIIILFDISFFLFFHPLKSRGRWATAPG